MEIKDEDAELETERDKIYEDNPSLENLGDFLKRIKSNKERIIVSEKDGRVKYLIATKRDRRKYGKFIVYDGWLNLIKPLDKSALMLLFYIIDIMKIGQHKVKITSDTFCEVVGLARPTFYTAINQLLEERWIFKTSTNKTYFINVRRFHRGAMELIYQNHEIERLRSIDKGVKIDNLEY